LAHCSAAFRVRGAGSDGPLIARHVAGLIRAEHTPRGDGHAGLLLHLPHDRVLKCLARLNLARGKLPQQGCLGHVAPHDQHAAVLHDDGGDRRPVSGCLLAHGPAPIHVGTTSGMREAYGWSAARRRTAICNARTVGSA